MSATDKSTPDNQLTAQAADPEVGVYTLSEFVFCVRAGSLPFEKAKSEEVDQAESPNWDYLPRHDLPQIESTLQQLKPKVSFWGIAGTMVLLVTLILAFTSPVEVTGLGLIFLVWIGVKLCPLAYRALTLAWIQSQAQNATAREPDLNSNGNQAVNWWELHKAGFRSVSYQDYLFHADWKLRGRPWRVLRRGSVRIPVFRKLHGDSTLHRQHSVRIAAYCDLIEECEGAESPYGVVLFGKGFDGVAIGNTPEIQCLFHSELLNVRKVIRQSQDGEKPPEPPAKSLCYRCPVGRPIVHRPHETEHAYYDRLLPVKAFRGKDGQRYHSHCGDRFRWLPPHERSEAKELEDPL